MATIKRSTLIRVCKELRMKMFNNNKSRYVIVLCHRLFFLSKLRYVIVLSVKVSVA